jgi:DNA-directed RNA polymerase subunit beta
MDQTNPLSEVTHKRRLSALGPGGLTRERAGFEVRDVHPTHYGRICPIETPEGPNIGLIASLSTFARVNEFGFIETPYPRGQERQGDNEIAWLDAKSTRRRRRVKKHVIAQANARLNEDGSFIRTTSSSAASRRRSAARPTRVDYMDVSPKQLVSSPRRSSRSSRTTTRTARSWARTCSARRCRCIRTEAPLVGTGMERVVARDSGVTVTAASQGMVESVDASRIVVKTDEGTRREIGADVDIYNLTKFMRSNQNTCINQKPVVRLGRARDEG